MEKDRQTKDSDVRRGPNATYGGRQFPDVPIGAKAAEPDTRGGKYGSLRSGETYDGPHVGPAGGSGEGKTFAMKGGYSGTRGVGRVGSMHGHPHLDGRKNGK